MEKLYKMLFREVLKAKGQFIAAAAVVFAGITLFSATLQSYTNLKNSLEEYYRQYKFLDYYAEVKSATPQAIQELEGIRGVKTAAGRITVDIAADMGTDRRPVLRLIAIPDGIRPEINNVFMVSGSYFTSKLQNSCLLDRKFAEFYNLKSGDGVKVVINRQVYELTISGVVGSPEFVYAVKSSNTITSSAEDFGILYVKESMARNVLGFEDAFNQVHVLFDYGVDKGRVIDQIEKVLKPYGFTRGTERKDQISNVMIQDEFKQLEIMALAFPMLFLLVASMIIYIMLRRLISNQRMLIGVMKAFGYANRRILFHYMLYALMIAILGSVPAVLGGTYLGKLITGMYTRIYSIPVMHFKIYWSVLFSGIGLGAGFCLLAGYNSAKRVLSIQPAQAMRSEIPKAGRRILLERMGIIWRRLPFGWKMSIRNIFRSRQRTLFTLLGTVFTIMFFMVSIFFLDCMDYVLREHFKNFQRQDYKVIFSKPSSFQDALELSNIRGVTKVEPIMEIPVKIKKDWIEKSTMVVGVVSNGSFYRFKNENKAPMEMPKQGILIAHSLAEKYSIRQGDWITIKSYIGEDKESSVSVAGIVKQNVGINCYMEIGQLGTLLQEGKFATGALIKVERGMGSSVKKELFKYPGIDAVEGRLDSMNIFLQYMELIYVFIGVMIFFGTVMGFAITFNTTVINIMERRRELASLKVLGYTRREIEGTILRENVVLGLAALIPGVIFGLYMCSFMAKQFSVELLTIDVVIYVRTYIITVISVFLFIVLAQVANRGGISGLDMIEVLKNREG